MVLKIWATYPTMTSSHLLSHKSNYIFSDVAERMTDLSLHVITGTTRPVCLLYAQFTEVMKIL